MFFGSLFTALLLAGLLLWCKKHLFQSSDPSASVKLQNQDIILVIIVSVAFVGAKEIIDLSFNNPVNILDSNFLTAEGEGLGTPPPSEPEEDLPPDTSFAIDIIPADKIKTRLSDIAGLIEAKDDINQFLDFIHNSKKFKHLGAKPPKGLIMYGPAGTGKTLLARAIAGETNATFISVSGSAFEELLVGRGAARIRELFALARKNKPAIIFIDEIDALAPQRSAEEPQNQIQTVNQLLSEMDNIDQEKNLGIYVLAATNRVEALDPALLRPGRFDWQLHIRLPSDEDRKQILTKLISSIVSSKDLNMNELVEKSAGFSGADLANLVNEAAIFAGRENKKSVDMQSFDMAFKKIAGYEKELSPLFGVKILSSSEIKTRFIDIAGMNEAKREVTEIVDFLRKPKEFTRLGAIPPSGILIYGPPGTGKTMMARAIAGEANAAFIAVSGSAFDERYVGVGAARVRELFKIARRYKPCIVFIDEIDALAPQRGSNDMGGQDQTINQFLNEMDNVQRNNNEGIIFIGATNRLDIIDPAVLRPGRFDRKVYFRLPQLQEREAILYSLLKKIRYAKNVDIKVLAQITSGYSGADLANLVNEAAIDATRKNKTLVDMASFEEANDRIALGVNQGSGSFTKFERKLTAYHEAGHALVGLLHPNNPRTFHKMTIGLRDNSLGVTHFRFESEVYSFTKKQYEALIATSLGGYIAEELIFGKDNVTNGAASDLNNANEIAKDMVTKYAMADDQSLIMDDIFSGREDLIIKNAEVILERDYREAKDILVKNMDKLHALANALLEHEVLDYEQIVKLLKLKKTDQSAADKSAARSITQPPL